MLSSVGWSKTVGRYVGVDIAGNLPRNPRDPILVGHVALAAVNIVYDPDVCLYGEDATRKDLFSCGAPVGGM